MAEIIWVWLFLSFSFCASVQSDQYSYPATTAPPSSNSSRSLGVLPQAYLTRKVMFQCIYYRNMTSFCQTVDTCASSILLQSQDLGNNFTIHQYDCTGPISMNSWAVSDGIIKKDLIGTFNLAPDVTDKPSFACAFFMQDATTGTKMKFRSQKDANKLQLFECFDTLNCNLSGATQVTCSGAVPWKGVWTSDESTDLRGNVTSVSKP